MLRLEGATVAFPDATVGPLDLDLPAGSVVSIAGPAAAGKSVVLKLAAGLVRPTAGRVLVGGLDLGAATRDELRDARARIGMVFQNDALFDSLTVLENVAYPLVRRGALASEAADRARTALSDVGLADAAAKRPGQLSGGMKKRVGVARALVAAPSLALYDDPTAGLDPATTLRILELLLEVHERLGGLTVIAGADPSLLWPRSTLAIAMDAGRIVAAGAPDEVAARPEVQALFSAEAA